MRPLYKQTVLERAEAIATAFEGTQRSMWSSMWPLGHCAVSSLLLNPLLEAAMPEEEWRVVVGVAGDCHTHAWIQNRQGDVVDPTWGQFDRDARVALRIEPAGNAGLWQAEIELPPEQEDFYRRSIEPTFVPTGKNRENIAGWQAGSKVKELFHSPLRVVPI